MVSQCTILQHRTRHIRDFGSEEAQVDDLLESYQADLQVNADPEVETQFAGVGTNNNEEG